MAANAASNLLALGCEDGTVRLISLANDTLAHYRRFDRVKCRVLSVAWGPPRPRQRTKSDSVPMGESSDEDSDDEDDWEDAWLVTGGSDSSIRKWDVKTGRVIDRMGTDKMRGERTLVWTVDVLGSVYSPPYLSFY
jgi:U3 small nucleolar RNA-associated protein 4